MGFAVNLGALDLEIALQGAVWTLSNPSSSKALGELAMPEVHNNTILLWKDARDQTVAYSLV